MIGKKYLVILIMVFIKTQIANFKILSFNIFFLPLILSVINLTYKVVTTDITANITLYLYIKHLEIYLEFSINNYTDRNLYYKILSKKYYPKLINVSNQTERRTTSREKNTIKTIRPYINKNR